jgi:hypothetical protein
LAFLLPGKLEEDAFEIAVMPGAALVKLAHSAAGDKPAFLNDTDPMTDFLGDADAVS